MAIRLIRHLATTLERYFGSRPIDVSDRQADFGEGFGMQFLTYQDKLKGQKRAKKSETSDNGQT